MKEFTMKKNERYHIYHQGKAIYFRKSFLEATGNMKNPEYQELMELQAKHPDFKLLTWNIAKPEKKKETYKGLTIEQMDAFLQWKYKGKKEEYDTVKAEFDGIKNFCDGFHKASSSGTLKSWFLGQYKDEYLDWAKEQVKLAKNKAKANKNRQKPNQNAAETASSEK